MNSRQRRTILSRHRAESIRKTPSRCLPSGAFGNWMWREEGWHSSQGVLLLLLGGKPFLLTCEFPLTLRQLVLWQTLWHKLIGCGREACCALSSELVGVDDSLWIHAPKPGASTANPHPFLCVGLTLIFGCWKTAPAPCTPHLQSQRCRVERDSFMPHGGVSQFVYR